MLFILNSACALFRGHIRRSGRLLNPILNPSARDSSPSRARLGCWRDGDFATGIENSKLCGVTGDLEFARLRNSQEIEGSSLCGSALDSQATLGIEELMLAHPGYTILVVTHKMAQ